MVVLLTFFFFLTKIGLSPDLDIAFRPDRVLALLWVPLRWHAHGLYHISLISADGKTAI